MARLPTDRTVNLSDLAAAMASCLLAICLCAFPEGAFAVEPADSTYDIGGASGGDSASFAKWYAAFKKAVQKNDKQTVAKFVTFPLSVNWGSEPDPYTGVEGSEHSTDYTLKSFLSNYDRIFSKSLRDYLINAWKSDFWDRDQGICLGNGGVWFDAQGNPPTYKVKTINGDAVPPSIDAILTQIKTAAKNGKSNQLANLYSSLGEAYDKTWRCLGSDRRKVEETALRQKAEEAYRKAISLRTGTQAQGAEQAKDYRMLADNLCLQEGRAGQAEDFYTKALALQQHILPPQSPALSYTVKTLIEYYDDMPAKKLALLKCDLPRQQLAIRAKEKLLGTKTTNKQLKDLVADYMHIGGAYETLGRRADAQTVYKKAYVLWKKLRPVDENIACDLLAPLVDQDMIAEAKKINANLQDYWFRPIGTKNLIFALARHGRIAESDALLNPALKEIKDSSYRRPMADYVEVYIIEKRLDKALALADSAVEECKDDTGFDVALQEKGKVDELLGHYAEAEKSYADAIAYLTGRFPNDPPNLKLRIALAEIYLKEKKFPQAEKTADEIVAYLAKSGKKTASLGDAISVQAKSLATRSPEKADKCFRDAIDIKSTAQGSKDKSVVDLMEAYAAFLSQNHRDAEAKAIRERIKGGA